MVVWSSRIVFYLLPSNELILITFLDKASGNLQIVTLEIVNLGKPAFIAMDG